MMDVLGIILTIFGILVAIAVLILTIAVGIPRLVWWVFNKIGWAIPLSKEEYSALHVAYLSGKYALERRPQVVWPERIVKDGQWFYMHPRERLFEEYRQVELETRNFPPTVRRVLIAQALAPLSKADQVFLGITQGDNDK